ncbi:MAG: 1-(5-phosphoribosyl)-5-[(5-phosphoribosylamino)methylideneamino]imidazole-4-carboxamide isomerase [Chloroflexota bacterium]|nr:1-(5-phosphoribosyl)-5-[(5-phosphoribosylamino)methylideneamino]imidazole-4-carboxamide isomerase [Chloroflexota bacterium]
MDIIPAIDLKDGRCVRLYQGDYNQETVFAENPAEVALRWYSQGASWLHVVDLDGAAAGESINLIAVEQIIKESDLLVELGGGIREEQTAEKLLQKGVKRIILGTVAIENPELVKKLCQRFGEAIVVGLDARDGKIAVHGWRKDTAVDVLQLSQEMEKAGVQRLIYTDIKRDGTLTEPNFDVVGRLAAEVGVPIIASGGISKLEHLQRLEKLGVEGAIIGKALYTGDIDLHEAIASVSHCEEHFPSVTERHKVLKQYQ